MPAWDWLTNWLWWAPLILLPLLNFCFDHFCLTNKYCYCHFSILIIGLLAVGTSQWSAALSDQKEEQWYASVVFFTLCFITNFNVLFVLDVFSITILNLCDVKATECVLVTFLIWMWCDHLLLPPCPQMASHFFKPHLFRGEIAAITQATTMTMGFTLGLSVSCL